LPRVTLTDLKIKEKPFALPIYIGEAKQIELTH